MSNDRILDKIKKCLALAKSSNGNEAATALRQAQILMEKHGVNQSTIDLSDVNSQTSGAGKSQNPPRYHQHLVSTIAEAFAVKPIYHPSYKGTDIEFIGFDSQPEVATYCYEVLYRQLIKDRKNYMGTLSRYKRANKVRKADLFAEAWVLGVYAKVMKFALTEKQEELVDLYIKQQHGKTEKMKSREHKVKKEDHSARLEGRLAGHNANLHSGMGEDKRTALEALN
ncbi:DUF2786 domain-containing protein [Marinomonas sp. S3726]|uniref:DUF2786 domain-containing protein n=1 Tax=Marinomonas sp. S3726 TaxID=579484 RepID=UPI0005FA8DD3|nr:DUF2786 domain-containing protein [Marinomonas sp. S3726]